MQAGQASTTAYTYADSGLLMVSTTTNDQGAVTSQTSYQYRNWDQAKIARTDTTGAGAGSTGYTYDFNGNLRVVNIDDANHNYVTFTNDATGQVMSRTDQQFGGSEVHGVEYFHNFGGQRLGRRGDTGPAEFDFATAIARRSNPNAYGTALKYDANFAENYEVVTLNSRGTALTASRYTVQEGETLQIIARNLWGDSALWWVLAEANGLAGGEALPAGTVLAVPNQVINTHHKSSTFRVFDPNLVLGDLAPESVQPAQAKPKKKKCGGIGKLLVAVVAAVVTYVVTRDLKATIAAFKWGKAATAVATVAAAAVGGATGSAVGQGLGIAIGVQDKFSWKGVAMAAIAAGVATGVDQLAQAGERAIAAAKAGGTAANVSKLGQIGKYLTDAKLGAIGGAVARGALANSVTQGLAMAVGLQKRFDWTGIAVGAAASAATVGIAGAGLPFGGAAKVAVAGAAGLVAGAATRSLIDGTSFGDNIMSALPDVIGATVGNMIAGELGRKLYVEDVPHNRFAGPGAATLEGVIVTAPRLTREEKLLAPLLRAFNSPSFMRSGRGKAPEEPLRSYHQRFGYMPSPAGPSGPARVGPTGFSTTKGYVVTPAALKMLRPTMGAANSGFAASGPTTAAGITSVMTAEAGLVTYAGINHAAGLHARGAHGGRIGPDGTAVIVSPFGGAHKLNLLLPTTGSLSLPLNPHERSMVESWKAAGVSEGAIQAQLQNYRESLARPVDGPLARQLRNTPGTAYVSGQLPEIRGQWLRGTDGNAGVVPAQVAERLAGQRFESFDAFRGAFWRTVADTPELANQFNPQNRADMRKGFAPIAPESQHYGSQMSYILHHRDPIQRGGAVYDMNNLLVVTPRYHQEVLDPPYHYGRSGRR